jgi:hypothetical protein
MDDDENELVIAFNNKDLESSDFEKLLKEADMKNVTFRIFSKKIRRIETKNVNL